ncbi:MAG: MFS transporter [Lentisphaerota bacterium]
MNPMKKLRLGLLGTVWMFSMFASVLSTFIMQAVSYYHATTTSAGTLESFQNVTIIIVTFVAFSFILKVGYKKALMSIIALMIVVSILMPIINNYWMIKIYLICCGVVLVGMKIGIYSSVSIATENESKQASFLSLLEATWMLASMAGMWVLSYFIKAFPENWLYSMWVFAALGIAVLVMWVFIPFDESAIAKEKDLPFTQQIKDLIAICKNKLVMAIIIIMFTASIVEMGVGAWLPGFYQHAMSISGSLSVQLASFSLILCFAGRIVVIFLLRFMKWNHILFMYYSIGFVILAIVLFTVEPSTHTIEHFKDVPFMALLLPLIGFILAPNAPLLNSSILARTSKEKQALLMTVLAITFAVASSIGARLVGQLMESLGGITGFKITTLIPMLLLVIMILPYSKFIQKGRIE